MQTFVPFADFAECAKTLDWRRLGKQRSECKQINKALRGEYKKAWIHHTAVLMWKGYEIALCDYAIAICLEWRRRGYADAQLGYFTDQASYWSKIRTADSLSPHWIGDDRIHSSHRSNLLRKDAEFYGKYGWLESPDLPYIWPSGAKSQA